VAGGVCPRGGARGGGRSPVGCSKEGPRLGDWARGRVEEEDGREAADHPAGEQRARGGEQRNAQLHSMARSRAAAKEKFPPRRCFARIRPRSGARGGGSRSLSGGSGERPLVVTGAVALAHGTGRPVGAVKRPVQLTSGPLALFEFPMIFNHSSFEIQNGDLPDVQNSPNFV
jgi:hypothetical protein